MFDDLKRETETLEYEKRKKEASDWLKKYNEEKKKNKKKNKNDNKESK